MCRYSINQSNTNASTHLEAEVPESFIGVLTLRSTQPPDCHVLYEAVSVGFESRL